MNAHTIRCGLSLFVIVGVVVIPWTQQESTTLFYVVCPNLQSTMNKKVLKTFSLLDFSKKYGKVHIDPIDEIHMGTWIKFKRLFFYHDDAYYYVNVSPKLGLISMMDIVSEARKWLVVQFDDESYYLCPKEELINL
ncbi:hypothetical protein ACIXNP_02660 [Bacteroides fragilis]